MSSTDKNPVTQNSVFLWLVLATCLVLSVPLVTMQFTTEVNWTVMDFVVMGILIFATGASFILISRKLQRKRRVLVGVGCAIVFLYVWAELAVGIFTSLGS